MFGFHSRTMEKRAGNEKRRALFPAGARLTAPCSCQAMAPARSFLAQRRDSAALALSMPRKHQPLSAYICCFGAWHVGLRRLACCKQTFAVRHEMHACKHTCSQKFTSHVDKPRSCRPSRTKRIVRQAGRQAKASSSQEHNYFSQVYRTLAREFVARRCHLHVNYSQLQACMLHAYINTCRRMRAKMHSPPDTDTRYTQGKRWHVLPFIRQILLINQVSRQRYTYNIVSLFLLLQCRLAAQAAGTMANDFFRSVDPAAFKLKQNRNQQHRWRVDTKQMKDWPRGSAKCGVLPETKGSRLHAIAHRDI